MLKQISMWILVATLSLTIGLHWEILQSAAWLGMVINYSQGNSLNHALSDTFDGQHPCKFCKIIAEGKKSESKPDSQVKVVKADLFFARAPKPFFPAAQTFKICLLSSSFNSRIESPLTPPPRFA